MDKKQKGQLEDKNYAMDVDRMINEGMAGGMVHVKYGREQIEAARELDEEKPPNEN